MTRGQAAHETSIRPMAEGEIDAVAALWSAGWHDGHAGLVPETLTRLRTLESFRARIVKARALTRVAVRGETVLGFSMVKGAELYQFYVAREARGTGLAGRLMADAEVRIRAAGHTTAFLNCAIGNERAAGFYRKAGWSLAGTEPATVDTSEGPFEMSIWRFEKRLATPEVTTPPDRTP
ncbi:MAG: GNAT family N-acetyltransferase [Pseudomonadota bacterium]